jgi:hypothetical protein
MITLYFSPGGSSLASHIGLEETGAPYELKPILLAKQQQKTETYLTIKPRGKVPALSVDGKIVAENMVNSLTLGDGFRRRNSCRPIRPKRRAASGRCADSPASSRRSRTRGGQGKREEVVLGQLPGARFHDSRPDWIMGRDFTAVDGYAQVSTAGCAQRTSDERTQRLRKTV